MLKLIEISRIERKGKNKILVLSDNQKLLLTNQTVKEYSLTAGLKITTELLKKVKFQSDSHRAEEYVLYLLARGAYSTGMLQEKMQHKGYDKNIISQMLAALKSKGLLDDTLFARQFTEATLRQRPAGKSFIIAKLCQKKIPLLLAKETVDDCFQETNEEELAFRLLQKRQRYLSKFELETACRKAYNYLSRKSIGYQAARAAFERLSEEGLYNQNS